MARNRYGMAAAFALALFSAPLAGRAADDPYASLKPLLGNWVIDRDCKVFKDRILIEIRRLPKSLVADIRDAKNPGTRLGRADIFNAEVEDRYKVVVALPNNKVLSALNIKSVVGSLTVSDDPDEPDGPGKDYLTYSSRVSVLSNLVTVKLRDKYKKATFLFTNDSPLGKEQCRGSAVKQPVKKQSER